MESKNNKSEVEAEKVKNVLTEQSVKIIKEYCEKYGIPLMKEKSPLTLDKEVFWYEKKKKITDGLHSKDIEVEKKKAEEKKKRNAYKDLKYVKGKLTLSIRVDENGKVINQLFIERPGHENVLYKNDLKNQAFIKKILTIADVNDASNVNDVEVKIGETDDIYVIKPLLKKGMTKLLINKSECVEDSNEEENAEADE